MWCAIAPTSPSARGAGQIGDVDVRRYCPYIAIAWRSGGGEEVAEEVAGVAGLDGGDVFG